MPRREQRETIVHRIGRTIRYTILLLGASLLVMTLSYHVTLWYASSHTPPIRPASAFAEEETMQGFSQELTNLMREYLDRASREGDPPGATFQSWSRDNFAPRASDLRRRVHASSIAGAAMNALRSAADRVVTMAREPEQVTLRHLATDNVFDAAAAVEDRVMATGTNRGRK